MSDVPDSSANNHSQGLQAENREAYPVSQMIIPCLFGMMLFGAMGFVALWSIPMMGIWGVILGIIALLLAGYIFSIPLTAMSASNSTQSKTDSASLENIQVEEAAPVPLLSPEDEKRLALAERKHDHALGWLTGVFVAFAGMSFLFYKEFDQPIFWIAFATFAVILTIAAKIERKYEKEVDAIKYPADGCSSPQK